MTVGTYYGIGQYAGLTYAPGDKSQTRFGSGPIHWLRDESSSKAVCGFDFTGEYTTKHPITNGAALSCPECKAAWKDFVHYVSAPQWLDPDRHHHDSYSPPKRLTHSHEDGRQPHAHTEETVTPVS